MGCGESNSWTRICIRREPEAWEVLDSFCPICGELVYGNGRMFYGKCTVKPFHAYPCKNLRVCFCDDCVSGVGGVDIICKVLEASPELRARVEQDCESILAARRQRKWELARERGMVLGVGLGILAGVMGVFSLIEDPEDAVPVVAGIALMVFLAITGLLQWALYKKERVWRIRCVVLGILAAVVGICCLIWKPEDVLSVVGGIVFMVLMIGAYLEQCWK